MRREWPLMERSGELDRIGAAVNRGNARGIVLSGPAGVGRTRLAREALPRCGPANACRHWIVGTASAQAVPLGAFAGIATGVATDPLQRVQTVIDTMLGDRDRPVVLGVDDAHLLDDLSAFAVHQLVSRRLATVILTIRSGDVPPDAVTAIWKDEHLDRLELQPLSPSATARLVETVLGDPVHSLSVRRLWEYTGGNVLYLRHLLESEINAGRMVRRSGLWLWDGDPGLPPTLVEILKARLAPVPESVQEVLDAVAVAEPLDSDVLAAITDPDALAQAESFGLVRVDTRTQPAAVCLGDPMLGEVRRLDTLRLRRLRGRIATELARKSTTDPRDLVRHAMLTIDSDLPRDSTRLVAAASAAMRLSDQSLAETLAKQAVDAGGGLEAKVAHATAITWQERGTEAEAILAELADQASGDLRTQISVIRALNLAANLGQTAGAESALSAALPADGQTTQVITTAVSAWLDAAGGRAMTAVDRADTLLETPPANDIAHMLSIWALVSGLGDLGRTRHIEAVADIGYHLAEQSADAAHMRITLAFLQATGYRLEGSLPTMDTTVARVGLDTHAGPYEQSWRAFLTAMSAMSRGALPDAQRLLQEAIAQVCAGDSGRMVKSIGRCWLATILAMVGNPVEARRELTAIGGRIRCSGGPGLDPELALAQAWVLAAEGAVSQAISITRAAAHKESERGRPAWEVSLLQAATQFGDHTTAARLAQLAGIVKGKRALAAAAHAAGLASRNGEALLEASGQYEEFGDRIAAADSAAHAAVAYQCIGRRGAALTASTTARRLSDECGGTQTPALQAATLPIPLTARQREIITLADGGLSTKEIADRLTMSVRSVQGHLFRASQRVGVNSRQELIAILRAQKPPLPPISGSETTSASDYPDRGWSA